MTILTAICVILISINGLLTDMKVSKLENEIKELNKNDNSNMENV